VDFALTEDQLRFKEAAREFLTKEVVPYRAEWDRRESVDTAIIGKLGELGFFGLTIPEEYGGLGGDYITYCIGMEELGRADSAVRGIVSVSTGLFGKSVLSHGSEEQKQEWLPRMAAGEAIGCFGLTEPDHGSDPSGMRTNAKQDGGDWVLNGSKMWITNGSIADIAVVWASTSDGIRGFLVPRAARGFTSRNIHKKLSLRASVTSELHFDDVRLPADAVLPGVTGLKGPLSCLSEARFGIVWGVTGAARACYESAVEYATTREQFGRKIGGFQLTQGKLAWMLADLARAQLLALHLGRLKEAGKITPQQVSLGKMSNVRTAIEIARQARTVLGANGVTLEYPVIRHANNLESVLTYEGTEEIHTLALGQAITGISAYR
jgi:glutaryl-CoA dehydrogenase